MSRVSYVNGKYLPLKTATVHIEDRGFQFADGIYEGIEVYEGNIVDLTRHLDRLERSLKELRITMPTSRKVLSMIIAKTTCLNLVENGFIYVQITRGVAKRDHAFPTKPVKPSLIVTVKKSNPDKNNALANKGVKVISVPDNRWERVDIKTTGLLPNVLAKQAAREAGAYEAWFIDAQGFVTEGSSTNAWIITKDKVLVTRPATMGILKGVTRTTLMDLAHNLGLKVEERHFTLQEAYEAKEAFVTAATTVVMPITQINDRVIGNGAVGEISIRLRSCFHDVSENVSLKNS
jgi:D-alanine transaminase